MRKATTPISARADSRANYIVLCGNSRTSLGRCRKSWKILIPVTTYAITTAKLGPGLGEAVGYRGAISDPDLRRQPLPESSMTTG